MADLRDHKRFAEGRWRYDEFKYSPAFGGKISPGDIDAVIERNGRFLFLEHKEYDENNPFFLPRGQEIMLRNLACLERSTVMFISGIAETGEPMYVRIIRPHFENDVIWDLRQLNNFEERHAFLYEKFCIWRMKAEFQRPVKITLTQRQQL